MNWCLCFSSLGLLDMREKKSNMNTCLCLLVTLLLTTLLLARCSMADLPIVAGNHSACALDASNKTTSSALVAVSKVDDDGSGKANQDNEPLATSYDRKSDMLKWRASMVDKQKEQFTNGSSLSRYNRATAMLKSYTGVHYICISDKEASNTALMMIFKKKLRQQESHFKNDLIVQSLLPNVSHVANLYDIVDQKHVASASMLSKYHVSTTLPALLTEYLEWDVPWLFERYVRGAKNATFVKAFGTQFLHQLLLGLQELHAANIVVSDELLFSVRANYNHPNISSLSCKFVDFEHAQFAAHQPIQFVNHRASHSAPELVLGAGSANSSIDIFEVGMLMLEMAHYNKQMSGKYMELLSDYESKMPFDDKKRIRAMFFLYYLYGTEWLKTFVANGLDAHDIKGFAWVQQFDSFALPRLAKGGRMNFPKLDLSVVERVFGKAGFALFQKLIDMNPGKRPTAQAALEDPFFDSIQSNTKSGRE